MHDGVAGKDGPAAQPRLDGIGNGTGEHRTGERPDGDVTDGTDGQLAELAGAPETGRAPASGELESEAVTRYNRAIALCRDKGDNGTRELLAELIRGEERSIEWLEAQLHIVGEIGKEAYLAEQIH